MDSPVHALSKLVGRHLQQVREKHHVSQERVATVARGFGVRWTRNTMSVLEAGGRQLSVFELAVLPEILAKAGVKEEVTVLPPELLAQWRTQLAELRRQEAQRRLRRDLKRHSRMWNFWYLKLVGHLPEFKQLRPDGTWTVPAEPTPEVIEDIAAEDAILKAAPRPSLNVPPIALALAAWKTWGRGLTEEREARLQPQIEAALTATLEGQADTPELTDKLDKLAAKAQAWRGHLSRQLLKEITPLVAGKSKRSRKRGR
jgi:hypothetical protein